MPWLNSSENISHTLQFGQFCTDQANQASHSPTVELSPNIIPQQPLPSPLSADTVTPNNYYPPNYVTPSNMFDPISNPPFNPNTAHLMNQPCLLQDRIHPASGSSINLQLVPQAHPSSTGPAADPLPSSLTHLPSIESPNAKSLDIPQKRGSADMEEDDFIKMEEPPTKQLLSEQKLFKQFGSLQLDKDEDASQYQVEYPDEEGSSDDETCSTSDQKSSEREQFNRYVYLLFKDKKSNAASFGPTDNAIDRLVREERERHSKAVILWTPPLKNCFGECDGESDSDDEELKYTDHRDFLKSNSQTNESFTITEVFEETDDLIEVEGTTETSTAQLSDNLMLD